MSLSPQYQAAVARRVAESKGGTDEVFPIPMDPVIKVAIDFAHGYRDCLDVEEAVVEVSESIPIWDDLTEGQKLEALEYVFKNEHDEDFGHSGCCKAIHQATAYYCVALLRETEEDHHFDDLDFWAFDGVIKTSSFYKGDDSK